MSSEVKRYDPINSDGTCGTCVEDPDYGAYVEFADYAALEAENAKLRAGQEPVAWRMWNGKTWRFCYSDAHGKRGWEALYTTPQPSAVPDAIAIAIREFEKSGWHGSKGYHAGLLKAASIAEEYAAPSAPATVQGDADNYRWLRDQHNNVNSDIGVYDGANILATQEGELDLDAAIAAAREEVMK